MQPISPNYDWENGVKQIILLKKIYHKSCILCQLLRTKTLASGSKCISIFFLFLPLFALYLLSGCDLFHVSCLSYISLMASLDILCFKPFNLKNKIIKLEHKKIFRGSSKSLKNISWPINICLKCFIAPTKTLQPPLRTYLMYGPEYEIPILFYLCHFKKINKYKWWTYFTFK